MPERTLELVTGIQSKVRSAVDAAGPEHRVSPPRAHILSKWTRCMSLFDAIGLLLHNAKVEEALLLSRPLFEESMDLHQLATRQAEADALILSWAEDSANRDEALFVRKGEALGLEEIAQRVRSRLAKRRSDIATYRAQYNIPMGVKLQSSENWARLRFKDAWWMYCASHSVVHGDALAHRTFRQIKIADNSYELGVLPTTPHWLALVAAFASASYVRAFESTAGLFGWRVPPTLAPLLEEIEARVETFDS